MTDIETFLKKAGLLTCLAYNMDKNMNNLIGINNCITNEYQQGKQSLFLAGLSLDEEIRKEVRNLPTNVGHRYLRFAVFLYDFFKKSDGKGWKRFWNQHSNNGQPVESEFDSDWEHIYNEDVLFSRIQSIKSKCWIVAGDTYGHDSEFWNCLRDAVHSFKKNNGEIVVSEGKKVDRTFIRLLLRKDTIERREYSRLVEYLATGTSATDLDEPWRTLVEKCEERLGREADVDWYLELDEEGSEGSFGVGFDSFPSNSVGSSWRKFKINGEGKEIPSYCKYHFFEPIMWDETVEVKYGKLSAPDNKTPLLFQDRQYEIFIHYISDKNDWRRHWWRWDAQPTMASAEKEFLVCAMDRTALKQLHKRSEPGRVQWEAVEDEDDDFQVELKDKSNKRVYYRRYQITDRPSDADLDITVGEDISITVMGKKPIGKAICNAEGIRLDKDTRNLVTFPSDVIELWVENARSDAEYSWTISVGDAMSFNRKGTKAQLILSKEQGFSEKNCITNLSIECKENGKRLGGIGGIVLPDATKGYLLDKKHEGNKLPANWTSSPMSPVDAISAYIDGLEKVNIEDPNHRKETICIPQTSFAWWFEIGNFHYRDLPEKARLFSYGDKDIPTFGLNELGKTYLCIVPDDDGGCLPEGFTKTTKGYKRCKISDLTETPESTVSREFITKEFRLPDGFGPALFNYEWPKAYNWPTPASEFPWASQGRKASLSKQSLKDLPNCILRASGIDNHVGGCWATFNLYLKDELKEPSSPAQMLSTLQNLPCPCPFQIVFIKVLEILEQKENRRFRGSCYDKPTDREWLLALSAMRILLNDGANLAPDSEKAVSVIFRRLSEDKAKSVLLARYLNLCEEVSRLPQLKARR